MVLAGYLVVPLAQFLIILHQLVVLPDNFVLLLNQLPNSDLEPLRFTLVKTKTNFKALAVDDIPAAAIEIGVHLLPEQLQRTADLPIVFIHIEFELFMAFEVVNQHFNVFGHEGVLLFQVVDCFLVFVFQVLYLLHCSLQFRIFQLMYISYFTQLAHLQAQFLVLIFNLSVFPLELGDPPHVLLLGLVGAADVIPHILLQLAVLLVVVPVQVEMGVSQLHLHCLYQIQMS